MYFAKKTLIPLLLIGAFLASCGAQPATTEPTPDVNATVAAGAQTMVASVFQTQTASAPTVTNTASPTVTVAATTSPIGLSSPIASPTQGFVIISSPIATGVLVTSTPGLVNGNNLRLISSYTVPEGPFVPGQNFVQYWQVENNGTKEWLYLYELVFGSGERMSGSDRRLSKKIPPYKWTTLSVELEAPTSNGTHTATWRFSDGAGNVFGAALPVSIKVQRPSYP
jgi:hypothetical protein